MRDSKENFSRRFKSEANQLEEMRVDLEWWNDAEDQEDIKEQLAKIEGKLNAYRESMYEMAIMLNKGE